MREFSLSVDTIDPHADAEEVKHEYGFELSAAPTGTYDAVVVAVSHKEYKSMPVSKIRALMGEHPILLDLKGLFHDADKGDLTYWSL